MKIGKNTFGENNKRAIANAVGYYGYVGPYCYMRNIISLEGQRYSVWETCKELATRSGATKYLVWKQGRKIPSQMELNGIKKKINKHFPNGISELKRIPGALNSIYFTIGRGYGKSRILCHSLMTMIHAYVFGRKYHFKQARETADILRNGQGETILQKTQTFRKKVVKLRNKYLGSSIRGPVNFMSLYNRDKQAKLDAKRRREARKNTKAILHNVNISATR